MLPYARCKWQKPINHASFVTREFLSNVLCFREIEMALATDGQENVALAIPF